MTRGVFCYMATNNDTGIVVEGPLAEALRGHIQQYYVNNDESRDKVRCEEGQADNQVDSGE